MNWQRWKDNWVSTLIIIAVIIYLVIYASCRPIYYTGPVMCVEELNEFNNKECWLWVGGDDYEEVECPCLESALS